MKGVYKISGMTCSSCARIVEKTLNKIPGIKKANVKLDEELVEITFEKEVAFNILKGKLLETGYDIEEIKENEYNKKRYKESRKNMILAIIISLPVMFLFIENNLSHKNPDFYVIEIITGSYIIFYLGKYIIIDAFKSIKKLSFNFDILIFFISLISWVSALLKSFSYQIKSFGILGITITTIYLIIKYMKIKKKTTTFS
ncbi:cation transporter [Marinitoga sp. 1155]|uniref:cation transporter n=1 Tax=Marinitoga sp. 1155 TaxID=1428448 RepID=UPI0006415329|nr:cation transporter [Marinitoga sp. 1155]KLO22595.1 hypothetical protein X274_07790 [Marinitoga sp. 1155]